jgi:DNA-binding response OmpR family regulator
MKRVLIADDYPDTAMTLAALFTANGYESIVAKNGREALDLAALIRPAIMLLDLTMPELEGTEVCRLIREKPWGRDMVIVAITGWEDENHRKAVMEAGCDHHLVKPVDFNELVMLLEKPEEFSSVS